MKCAMCNKDGKHRVTFSAYALGHAKLPRNKVTGHFNVVLCDSHARTMNKEDLLGKGGWEAIQQALLSKGKALLDSSTIELRTSLVD